MTKITYSIHEAANALSIGKTKLYEEINSGRLKAHKIGTRTVITVENIQKYLSLLEETNPRKGEK